jgi:hypothetical protein
MMLRIVFIVVLFLETFPIPAKAMLMPSSYVYETLPSLDYADDTGGQLIDGRFGSDNWRTERAYEWVGWFGAHPVMTFNLGASEAISSVEVGFNKDFGAIIALPYLVQISFSYDGVGFGDPWTYTIDNRSYYNGERYPISFDTTGAQGKYVRLDMLGGGWTFMDEVQFDDVSRGNSLVASHVGSIPPEQPSRDVPEPPVIVLVMTWFCVYWVYSFLSRRGFSFVE